VTNTPNSNGVPFGPLENKIKKTYSFDRIHSHYTNVISASHSKKFSSLTGPANIPSGGLFVNSKINHQQHEFIFFSIFLRLYSAIKRRRADPAIQSENIFQ
jgi:hypothetical protein